jgi:hypothetical protein
MTLEASRKRTAEDWSSRYVGFCSQQHATEWLSRPLPVPADADAVQPPATGWGERAALTGCALVALLTLLLLVVGSWTTVGLLLDRS